VTENAASAHTHVATPLNISLSLIGLMNEASDSFGRLSWKSIESFGYNSSGNELLVQYVVNHEVRKKRVCSAFASVAIVLLFCFVVAQIFSSDETTEDNVSEYVSLSYIPKFLVPLFESLH
jgi:hypothetical protein